MTEIEPDGFETGGRTPIQITTGPDAIRVLKSEIDSGVIPEVYVEDGHLVHMEAVSGGIVSSGALDDDAPLSMTPSLITPHLLAALLADHAFVYRKKYRKTGAGEQEPYTEETSPMATVTAPVLATKTWKNVPAFRGLIGAPILRRDGTLLQQPGYDKATGLYLASRVALDPVPEDPTTEQVQQAREFILNRFLTDFLWVDKADCANYIGLLVTPILRSYTRCVTPFGVITATQPGSGKTILTGGPGLLYGQRILPWPYADEELRKAVTAVLQETAGVVVFDNMAEGSVIDSAVLAQLITASVWSDRQLGSTKTLVAPNEKLWMATGNNLRVGGDMASRSVLVRLDPNMPHPEHRTGFAIDDLPLWMTIPSNQKVVLWHLLVLVLAWTKAGAPRRQDLTMRQFTPWAQAIGGLLDHHGVPGFLENAADIKGIDEDEARWTTFLAHWHERLGGTRITANDLRKNAEPPMFSGSEIDSWEGAFITTQRGALPNAVGLGRMLTGQVGRWRGEYVIRSGAAVRGDRAAFWVHRKGDAE